MVRSRLSALLALAAVGALVAVLVTVLVSGGTNATGAAPVQAATTETVDAAATVAEQPRDDVEPPPEPVTYAPDATTNAFKPRLSADSFVVLDADTGTVILALRERRRRPIASLTKVMTALIVIEDGELGKKIRVPKLATLVEPNKEGLVAGRWYQRRLLLFSALMVSANDSATALAHAAGDGSLARFYRRMNRRARELGMTRTTYASPSGLEDERNLSTALDQAILARAALQDPLLAKIVRTHRKLVKWPPPTYAKEWLNHNRMLTRYPGTYGVKTGYTATAGGCLAVAVERDGHHLIGVVLGSEDIWGDMPRLMDAAFRRLG
jgi:D-alanyl-D-alanine carboxypeptidase